MRIHIGIITAYNSLKNLLLIEEEIRKMCDITFLPYSSTMELTNLYLENEKKFDGILFSGAYPYRYITNSIGKLTKPCRYLGLEDRDIYLTVARLYADNPKINLDRVLFDANFMEQIYTQPDSFLRDIFPPEKYLRISTAFSDYFLNSNISMIYEELLREYRRLWLNGSVDLIVTGFANLANRLDDERIPYMLVRPSKRTMLETFRELLADINRERVESTLVACCLIEVAHFNVKQEEIDILNKTLERFNSEQNIIFVLNQRGMVLESITSNKTVQKLTSDYTTCMLTSYLYEALPFSTNIGWGIGYDIVMSHKNAQRAIQQSQNDVNRYTYLVNERNEMIGPLCGDRTVSYQLKPSARTNHIANELGISVVNLEKLISLKKNRNMKEYSASDLVFYLDITLRSANRILKKLSERGYAKKVSTINLNGRGRPAAIYEIDFEEIQL